MSVQRYDLETKSYSMGSTMERSEEGEWVDYDDHLEELKRRTITDEDLELLRSIARFLETGASLPGIAGRVTELIERLESDE